MGWFWASRETSHGDELCTVYQSGSSHGYSNSEDHRKEETGCPIMAKKGNSDDGGMNLLNYMPKHIPETKQPGQKLDLPVTGSTSSIPKATKDASGNVEFWEYPSPQKMYNAMLRKGKIDPSTGDEIPEDAVESMVYVHNFLNEGCWEEILEWEKPHFEKTGSFPKLWKFMGRPDTLSPRARWYHLLGTLFPSKFSAELPFDRHDWIVLRPDPSSNDSEVPGYRKVRYVIDFYGGPDDADGLPTFNVDVRPGIDNLTNARDRLNHWMKPVLDKYMPDNNR